MKNVKYKFKIGDLVYLPPKDVASALFAKLAKENGTSDDEYWEGTKPKFFGRNYRIQRYTVLHNPASYIEHYPCYDFEEFPNNYFPEACLDYAYALKLELLGSDEK